MNNIDVHPGDEVRSTNETTGGQKGVKIEAYDLIPTGPLRWLAEMYGRGARKYASRNWERGYEWSKSYAALQRHANAFWSGEDLIPQNEAGDDPTAGVPHLVAVAWHAFALLEWATTHPELDDRPNGDPPARKGKSPGGSPHVPYRGPARDAIDLD